MVGCSNGKAYSIDALEALEDAGYENLCFVRGGYNAWFRIFDNKFGESEGLAGWAGGCCRVQWAECVGAGVGANVGGVEWSDGCI